MNLRKSIRKILLFACLTVPLSIFSQSDTLEVPFLEDWSSGSLDTNGWTVTGSHWSINFTEGSLAPSVEFDGRNIGGLYYEELYSAVFNSENYHVGDIWLSFDTKLESNDSLEVGRLSVYGSHDGGWYNFKTINNNDGSFDWVNQKINITEIALDKCFQIKFKADGRGHSVNAWYIDNIQIYRNCSSPSPSQFALKIDTLEYNKYQLTLSWSMDEPEQGWIYWDDGVHAGGVGACPDCDLFAASRWDPGQLIEYDGLKISKIKAFLNDSGYNSLAFNIWTGMNAANLIYEKNHDTLIYGNWIEHTIDTALFLDADEEYWFGYNAYQHNALFPLGADDGPSIVGYGGMVSFDGGGWDNISDMGIDVNWLIHVFLEDTAGNEIFIAQQAGKNAERSTNLLGYNLYQSINGSDYELLEFIPWEAGDTSHSIVFDASPYLHCYQLTALWESETDTCESAPAISKDNPEEDFVCVLLVGNEENRIEQSDLARCFPNPFSNSTTIEYTLQQSATVQISIFNHLGKQVGLIQQNQSVGKQQITWDASGLPTGVYYFRLKAGDQLASGKMVVVR